MKQLYLSLNMGAAGDMLAAALYELLPDDKKSLFVEMMNALGLEDVRVAFEPSVKCGITGTHFSVTVHGEQECSEEAHAHEHEHHHAHGHNHEHEHHHEHGHNCEHEHHHEHGHNCEHEHHHGHHHEHRGLADIEHIVSHMPISDRCRGDVMAVYKLIAEAESRAHGKPVELVHFHEVGALDAVADITAVCMLIELLAPERITASPVRMGFGTVNCAHGILPVPAPATAHILTGIPSYAGEIRGELCTPTGAALIRHFAESFEQQPVMRVERIGYGMGRKNFAEANCVRAMLGESVDDRSKIVELSCCVDDMTGEEIGFALSVFMEMGAKDAYTIPIGMKKSRPGVMICILCGMDRRDEFVRAVFKHTSTLGVREMILTRHELSRSVETLKTQFGEARLKSANGFGANKAKLEYDDVAQLALEKGLSLREMRALIERDTEQKN